MDKRKEARGEALREKVQVYVGSFSVNIKLVLINQRVMDKNN